MFECFEAVGVLAVHVVGVAVRVELAGAYRFHWLTLYVTCLSIVPVSTSGLLDRFLATVLGCDCRVLLSATMLFLMRPSSMTVPSCSATWQVDDHEFLGRLVMRRVAATSWSAPFSALRK